MQTSTNSANPTYNPEEEVTHYRDALASCPYGHGDPRRFTLFTALCEALLYRFKRDKRPEDIDEFISLLRESLEHYLPDFLRPLVLCKLGLALSARFDQTGAIQDIEESIAVLRGALQLQSSRDPDRCMLLMNLGNALRGQFTANGEIKDLDESISSYRDSLERLPPGEPLRSSALFDLGTVLSFRFRHIGVLEDLNESISLLHGALELRPPGHSKRSTSLFSLGIALKARFDRIGGIEDLQESISFLRCSLELRPVGHAEHFLTLEALGCSLSTRYQQSGGTEDLAESMSLFSSSLSLLPPGHPARPVSLGNLGTVLMLRFEHNGAIEDVEQAISFFRKSLELLPPRHPSRITPSMNLGYALFTRFEKSGGVEELEEAISFYRESLELQPHGQPSRSSSLLMNLGDALSARFGRSGRLDDLEESISLFRDSVQLRRGYPDQPLSLINLGRALKSRFQLGGCIEDLKESIYVNRVSLGLRPPGHPLRSASLMSLANVLLTRHEESGKIEHLEESISLFQGSLALRPPGHPLRFLSSMQLSGAIAIRFIQSGNMKDLDGSISYYRDSLGLPPPNHPLHSAVSFNIGRCILARFDQTNRGEDLEEAVGKLRQSAEHEFSLFPDRLQAAYMWAITARKHGLPTALLAYERAIDLFEASMQVALTLTMQHELMGERSYLTLAGEAASCAIEHGDLKKAIELFEQGRAVVWSYLRGLHASITDLANADKELADRYEDVSSRLQALSANASKTYFPGADTVTGLANSSRMLDDMMAQSRRLLDEQKETIGQIRLVPGFEDYQRRTPFTKLQKAAAEGPVIILNLSRYRSDALIVLRDQDPIVVPLSEDRPSFYEDMVKMKDNLYEERKRRRNTNPEVFNRRLNATLIDLWRLVVSKVVVKLTDIGLPKGSRIWWCPTSVLQVLPLHAAGQWRVNKIGRTIYQTHEYVSSYTPTLNALIQARSNIKSAPARSPPLLFVGQMENSPQFAEQDRNIIKNLGLRGKHIVGENATPEAVLESLESHPWVHFACHGELDPGEPSNSSFKLFGDERLSLLDIAGARLRNADLAFSATCRTEDQTERSGDDELLNFAAGVQFCGFRSVVGTMWPMPVGNGPSFTEAFYAQMLAEDETSDEGFKRSARALHAATKQLREIHDVPLESWVNFVHIGA